jgi:hypothetical protein
MSTAVAKISEEAAIPAIYCLATTQRWQQYAH